MASDIKFKASVDSKKGKTSLKELDKGVTKIEKSTKKAGAGFKQLAVGVAAGAAAFVVATRALRGLIQWTGEAIEKSAEQEAVEKRLETVLKSTAGAAGLTKDELLDMASALQQVTTYGDETIIGAQNLLLTFTKIGKEVFPDALETVMDMSTALGVDLKQSALSLGKALNDPILGVTALRRVGVSFTEQQTEQIKTMVKSGDVLSAQKLILEELRVEFGGMSRAAVDTYEGAVKQLSDTYGDLQETVGDAVTQNEGFRDLIQLLNSSVRDLIASGLVEWFTDIVAQALKGYPAFESLATGLALLVLLLKKQAEEQEKSSETMKNWFEHIALNDDLQIELRKQIAAVTEETEEQDEAMKDAAESAELWDNILQRLAERDLAANIKEAVEALDEFSGVEADLALAWEQDLIGMDEKTQEFSSNLIVSLGGWAEGYEDTTERIKAANELLMESWNLTTQAQLAFTQVALGEFIAMEASLKGFVSAILGTFEKWAIGQIIPKIMAALPFPINLLATGGAILAIKAIFAEIKGKEAGGWVGLHGEEIIRVGERGPEYITSNSQISNIQNQRGGNRAVYNIYITTTKEVNAEQLMRDIRTQEERYG